MFKFEKWNIKGLLNTIGLRFKVYLIQYSCPFIISEAGFAIKKAFTRPSTTMQTTSI